MVDLKGIGDRNDLICGIESNMKLMIADSIAAGIGFQNFAPKTPPRFRPNQMMDMVPIALTGVPA